ncbi:hypothetical protein [Fluviispira vulneris]|uniref:hypothetical protein n=1 Tax=Fluviispira vulneris TaxID=2763012 RepID=UPI00164744F3|nr:hypothetical protein [Fluviispira vulneris]
MINKEDYKFDSKEAFKRLLDGKSIISKFGIVYKIKGKSIQTSTEKICSFAEFLNYDNEYLFKEFIKGKDYIFVYNKKLRTFEKILEFDFI